jgi:DNA-binding CsgD family transcriptional regulator
MDDREYWLKRINRRTWVVRMAIFTKRTMPRVLGLKQMARQASAQEHQMFDPTPTRPADVASRERSVHAAAYGSDDRAPRAADSMGSRWLMAALDEVDYGIVLLDADARVQYVNHTARTEMNHDHPLQLIGLTLRARDTRDAVPLHHALDDASRRGLRRLLTIGRGEAQINVSIVPLRTSIDDQQAAALLVLGKRHVGGVLAVQAFARLHGLTSGETRVLLALCDGLPPIATATQHGVAISTVRSQIGSIRAKTGAASICDLIHKVASLPPLMSALRNSGNSSLELTPLAA